MVATKTGARTTTRGAKHLAPDKHFIFYVLSGILVIYGSYMAIHLRWVGDDIFIGLRYVENFLDGHGWVYNTGEHVEGYTDFLWLVIIAFFQNLRFDPITTSINLGILSYVFIVLTAAAIDCEINKYSSRKFYLPVVLILLTLNYDFSIWATGGLETSFITLLYCLIFYLAFYSTLKTSFRLLLIGIIGSLSTLTRPDSLLIFAMTNLFLLSYNLLINKTFRKLLLEQCYLVIPWLIIYVPYFLFITPNLLI
jgi:arabinofuranosyltransferase